MSTLRIDPKQNIIMEDKARVKKAYQAQTKHGRGRTKHSKKSTVIVKTPLSSNNDVSAISTNRVRTFQNTSLRGSESHRFTDSKGVERNWHGLYTTVYTQSRDNYQVMSINKTLEVQKDMLKPHMIKFKHMVERLQSFAYQNGNAEEGIINQEYVLPAQKLSDLHEKITNRLRTLEIGESNTIDHKTMLDVLKACEQDLASAKEDTTFAQPRGFIRKTPFLSSIARFLDILGNHFAFLDKKIGKMLSGEATPVFESQTAYTAAMYKPAKTHTLKELDALLSDVQWYHAEINQTYEKMTTLSGD